MPELRIDVIATLTQGHGRRVARFTTQEGREVREIQVAPEGLIDNPDCIRLLPGETGDRQFWVFRNKLVRVEGAADADPEEVRLHVKHKVFSQEESLARLKREVELFERGERDSTMAREPISEDVRLFVWRRDEGRCVRCGGTQNLEFDHIIPVSKGGSNTERNLQLLCEKCNREKGAAI